MTTENIIKENDSIYSRNDLSEIELRRNDDGIAITKILDSTPNVPEKIFEKFGLPVVIIDNVLTQGAGFKKTFIWNNQTYKRPELVAKAYYEQQGYMVTWSEGVAWNIVIKTLEKIFCVRFGNYFTLIDDREQQLEKLFGMISKKRFHPDQIPNEDGGGDSRFKELAEKQVNSEYQKRSNNLNGVEGKYEFRLLSIAQSIFDNDKVAFYKFTKTSKLESKNSFEELSELMKNIFIESQKTTEADSLDVHFPKVGDLVFNVERDKFNLNEWSIKFAKDLLLKMSWVDIYNKYFESCRNFTTRYDLTLVNIQNNEVKFVEVKVDDSFTMYQKIDLVNSIQYKLNVELAIIK